MTDTLDKAATTDVVPALAYDPATEITAEDVALPRLYVGQYMSDHVKDKQVDAGDLFSATGADDPDPQVLAKEGDDEGVTVHVLSLRKGKSISDGGELTLFDFDDPDAPEDAWVTYNYAIVIPDHDTEVPYKWLLTKTGRPAAQQMNMVIKKNAAKGPAYELAFQVTTAHRENQKGEFYVPRVRHVDAKPENIKIAENLAIMISGQSAEVQATGNEPAL